MHPVLLAPEELQALEAEYPEGVSSRKVIDLFRSRGVKLSEATFRRYVQLGLLPACARRVGEKGKHKGSRGIYPVNVVRRLNLLKKMMYEGLTLEEIQHSFVAFRNDLDALQGAIEAVFREFSTHMESRSIEVERRKLLKQEFRQSRENADELLHALERIGSTLAASPRLA